MPFFSTPTLQTVRLDLRPLVSSDAQRAVGDIVRDLRGMARG